MSKKSCNCIVCCDGSIETLPWYAQYIKDYTEAKEEEERKEEKDRDDSWMDYLEIYYEVEILRAVIQYGNGTCLYRMYRRVDRLWRSGELEAKDDNNKKLLDRLNEILTMSDGGVFVEHAFDLVLED